MSREKNDGRGRLGGRVKGTPNKDRPLKSFLHEHSLAYFTPSILAFGMEEYKNYPIEPDRLYSQYELDLYKLKPAERVKMEQDLLKFHTPLMQATSVDMTVADENQSLSQRLLQLSQEPKSE